MQTHIGTESILKSKEMGHYQMPVDYIFSTIEVEDYSSSEETPEIVSRAADAREGSNNEVGLTGKEIISRLRKFSLVSRWHDFHNFFKFWCKKGIN